MIDNFLGVRRILFLKYKFYHVLDISIELHSYQFSLPMIPILELPSKRYPHLF